MKKKLLLMEPGVLVQVNALAEEAVRADGELAKAPMAGDHLDLSSQLGSSCVFQPARRRHVQPAVFGQGSARGKQCAYNPARRCFMRTFSKVQAGKAPAAPCLLQLRNL